MLVERFDFPGGSELLQCNLHFLHVILSAKLSNNFICKFSTWITVKMGENNVFYGRYLLVLNYYQEGIFFFKENWINQAGLFKLILCRI